MELENICDIATGTEGKTGEELAAFRCLEPGKLEYGAKAMTEEQKSERRRYLRKILLKYNRWANLPNAELDEIRVRQIHNGYLVEDKKGHDFFLPFSGISPSEAQFRRVRSMMPFEFMGLCGKDFQWSSYQTDISKSREFVNRYILNFEKFKMNGMGLYIYSGTKGSGKTMLACCILNEISHRFPGSVKFVNILDFLEMTKKGFDETDTDVRNICQSSLLIVDDLGVQMTREWVETVLYKLINDRYTNRLPTIYTSNIQTDALRIDDRIIDRIESTTYPVSLPEEPIRKQKRQQERKKLLEEIEKSP